MQKPVHTGSAPQTIQLATEVTGSIDFSAWRINGSHWSLSKLRTPEDVETNSEFATEVAQTLRRVGGHRAYAPSPFKFNGEVINPEDLSLGIPIGKTIEERGMVLYRNPDKPADGTVLCRPGDAGLISAGGCPIIIAALDDKLVFAHAGRDCVLDRTYIESDGSRKGREHESVVDSVCAALEATSSSVRYARVHVLGSIRPEHFMHPFGHSKHGDYNAHLYRFLKRYYPDCYQYEKVTAIGPDLPRIIRQQFVDRGVLESQVRLEDAYLPEGLSARFQGGNADRYLTVVVRRT